MYTLVTLETISLKLTSFCRAQMFPSNGIYSMKRTFMGLCRVSSTKSHTSSSLTPLIRTTFTCRMYQAAVSLWTPIRPISRSTMNKSTATEVHIETSTFCNIVSLLLSFRFRAVRCTTSYASKGLKPVTEWSQQAEEKKRHLDRPESQLNGVVNGGKHPLQAPPPCQLLKAIFSQRVQAEIQERQACTKARV